MDVDFIYFIKFSKWFSLIVIVIKKNGKFRMCVDYYKLNEAIVKDEYFILDIYEVLDEVVDVERVSLCDGYLGYYQIDFAEEDCEKTVFIIF